MKTKQSDQEVLDYIGSRLHEIYLAASALPTEKYECFKETLTSFHQEIDFSLSEVLDVEYTFKYNPDNEKFQKKD